MDDLLAELDAVAAKADAYAKTFRERLGAMWNTLEPGIRHAERAWCGSRIGYHAEIYIGGMEPRRSTEIWDPSWGRIGAMSNRTRGERWSQWNRDDVYDWVLKKTGLTREDIKRIDATTEATRTELLALRDRARPVIDVLAGRDAGNAGLQEAQKSVGSLDGELLEAEATQQRLAGRYQSADRLALSQGPRLPVHEHLEMHFGLRFGIAVDLETLARQCRYVRDYVRTHERVAAAFNSATSVPNASPPGSCRVLFLAANPNMDLALDEEIRAIEESIRTAEHRARVDFRPRLAARPGDLLRAMNELRPAVVHFSGHGDPQTAIYLHDGAGGAKAVKGYALELMFDGTRHARVVVLASCYSAKQAKAILNSVECVVGMKRDIGDAAARVFSGAFYNAIGSGSSVSDAFKQGCAAIALEDLGDERVPVLLVREGVDETKVFLVGSDSAVAR